MMSLEHFLNSSVFEWGSCRLPCGSLVSKHVPWLQVLSSQPGWGSATDPGPARVLGRPLPLCWYLERHRLCLCMCVFSLSRQSASLLWQMKLVPSWGVTGWAEHGIWAGPVLPWLSRDRPSAWPDKKPLLQLAFLYLTGVFSAVVAEETPKCRNLAHAKHPAVEGESKRTTRMRVQKTTSGSALTWIALSYYGQLRSNFGNARPDHCSSGNWFPFV